MMETFLASGKVGDDVGIDEALTEFVNPQNIGTMEAFLTQLVDLVHTYIHPSLLSTLLLPSLLLLAYSYSPKIFIFAESRS